jgi:hypothetical protein
MWPPDKRAPLGSDPGRRVRWHAAGAALLGWARAGRGIGPKVRLSAR